MAARGEKVIWNKDSQKEVAGSLGTSEELQKVLKQREWNEYVVIAKGNHLQHFINGRQTVDVIDECEAKRAMSGVLALQLHAGSPMKVQFKNIRLNMLSSVEGGASTGDLKKLQGQWQMKNMEAEGNSVPSENITNILVDIKGSAFKILNLGSDSGGTFTVDDSKRPKQIDVNHDGGGEILKGIYELNGDNFRVCYAKGAAARPEAFSTTSDSQQVMITYERKKE
jgi:uncharacterized protein (TIGR03067 family)